VAIVLVVGAKSMFHVPMVVELRLLFEDVAIIFVVEAKSMFHVPMEAVE